MFSPIQRNLFMFGIGSIAIIVNLYITKKVLPALYTRRNVNAEKEIKDCYYHSIYTTIENAKCRPCINAKQSCSNSCSYKLLNRICSDLASAKETISLCMYIVSLESVYEELVAAYKRGVQVRIITDYEMTRLTNTVFAKLSKNGIDVKHQGERETSMMHHKFCLIDEHDSVNGRVFFGSLNLTMLGISGNFEHVLFTNHRHFISRYSDEFESIWEQATFLRERQ